MLALRTPCFGVWYPQGVRVPRPVTRGAQRGEATLENFRPPLEKCVGHSLKTLDIVQKIWVPLGKVFAPPGVPSWLRACVYTRLRTTASA